MLLTQLWSRETHPSMTMWSVLATVLYVLNQKSLMYFTCTGTAGPNVPNMPCPRSLLLIIRACKPCAGTSVELPGRGFYAVNSSIVEITRVSPQRLSKTFFATPGNRQPDYVGRCRWRCPGVDALQKPRDMSSFSIFISSFDSAFIFC